MTRRRHDTDEGIAAAQEEQERIEKLNSQGLCHSCEENPQNPAISASLCMNCYMSEDFVGCDHKDCINSPVGNFRQGQYCEAHLIDRIHSAYHSFLEHKDYIEKKRQKLEQRASGLDRDPRDSSTDNRYISDEAHEFYDDWVAFQMEEQELGELKAIITNSMKQVDKPFPEGFKAFE